MMQTVLRKNQNEHSLTAIYLHGSDSSCADVSDVVHKASIMNEDRKLPGRTVAGNKLDGIVTYSE